LRYFQPHLAIVLNFAHTPDIPSNAARTKYQTKR
jgi:hypothetical protein